MEIKTVEEYLKSKGLKNPPLDSGISGGGDAPRIRVSDVMKEYASQFIDLDYLFFKFNTPLFPLSISSKMVSITLFDFLNFPFQTS